MAYLKCALPAFLSAVAENERRQGFRHAQETFARPGVKAINRDETNTARGVISSFAS